jgi:hypothetical protein
VAGVGVREGEPGEDFCRVDRSEESKLWAKRATIAKVAETTDTFDEIAIPSYQAVVMRRGRTVWDENRGERG